MSEEDQSQQTIIAPVRPQDRRVAELEELRKKQLAKSRLEDTAGGSNQQPVAMESWFEQQRKQNKLIRLQQKDATENLRNNNYVVDTRNVKEQSKQKQQEATEMLRNYRGQPEAVLSHQVKKHAKNENMNKNIVPQAAVAAGTDADVIAPNPKEKLETVEGKFHNFDYAGSNSAQSVVNDVDGNSMPSDRGRSASLGTNDWSVISGNDNESNASDSTAVNIDISEIAGILSNGPDAAAGVVSNYNLNRSGHDTPSSASYVDASAEIVEKGMTKQSWNVTNITVSFGLLMHENETPPEGTFSSPIQNDVVDNLLYKMRLIAERSLENSKTASIVRHDESPLSIKIVKDASYKAPVNRPGVLRNLVKATIPIKTEKEDHQGVPNAKALVYSTLRMSLKDLTSRS